MIVLQDSQTPLLASHFLHLGGACLPLEHVAKDRTNVFLRAAYLIVRLVLTYAEVLTLAVLVVLRKQ